MGKREKIGFNEKSEVVFQTIDSNTNEVIRTETPEQRGLFREKEFYVIFKRVALNPRTLLNIEGYFISKVIYRLPNRDGFDYHWFYFEKGFSVPCARILDPRMQNLCGLTFQVSPNDEIFTKKIGQPKRLTNEAARKAMIDKAFDGIPILGIYEEDGSERV